MSQQIFWVKIRNNVLTTNVAWTNLTWDLLKIVLEILFKFLRRSNVTWTKEARANVAWSDVTKQHLLSYSQKLKVLVKIRWVSTEIFFSVIGWWLGSFQSHFWVKPKCNSACWILNHGWNRNFEKNMTEKNVFHTQGLN